MSLLLLIFLSGCAHQGAARADAAKDSWIQATIDYQPSLDADHTQILNIDQPMREMLQAKFSGRLKYNAVHAIAKWLIDEDGYAMQYDDSANLVPVDAYHQKRGNCLSFTMLLVALAKELDIEILFNSVDIPDTYGLDRERGMVYYRHVNGILKTPHIKQIFDLAMNQYDTGYPQRIISKKQAIALFYNNLAVDSLGKGDFQEAQHAVKMGITLSPDNADLWINLGVILKRDGQMGLAKKSFEHAISLDRNNAAAASNLERFYREQGLVNKAATYQKQAERARRKNPYFHYQAAIKDYRNEQYKGALRATKKAIFLHNKDPRFYELKSLISQQQHNYKAALKSLDKAYKLSSSDQQRGKYVGKANLVAQRAIDAYERRQQEFDNRVDANTLREQLQQLY